MHLASNALLAATLFSPTLWSQCEIQKLQPAGAGLPSLTAVDVQGDEAVLRLNGHVLLCSWTPFGWTETGELQPSDAPWFGFGEGDLEGNTLVIGSPSYSGDSAVYVYERASADDPWIETDKLVPPAGSPPEVLMTFGTSVALEGDVLAVGAPGAIVFLAPGRLSIYERQAGRWIEEASFSGLFFPGGGSALGTGVEVEGGQVFATEPFDGRIKVYEEIGGEWQIVQFLGGGEGGDGSHLAAGNGWLAVADDLGPDEGVFLFKQLAGTWLKAGSLPGPAREWSPYAVEVNGSRILAGDPGLDPGGSVLLFEQVAGAWQPVSLFPHDLQAGDDFGASLALDGDRILASSWGDTEFGSTHGSTYAFSASGQGCPTLATDLDVVSSTAGGVQTLALDAGPGHAGQLYLLAGTLSGFWPGTVFAGQTIPLNADLYLVYTLFHGGSPPLIGNLGFLDSAGKATAQVVLPADPLLAGLQAHHAFGVVDTGFNLVHISNPVPLLVLGQ